MNPVDAAQTFTQARTEERALLFQIDELKIDARVAQRQADYTEEARIQFQLKSLHTAWYHKWTRARSAASDVCEALGVDPKALKDCL